MKTQKIKTSFLCKECGYESAQWLGRCPSCGNWNTFVEEKFSKESAKKAAGHLTSFSSKAQSLKDIPVDDFKRHPTGIKEFDIIVGGGIVGGSLILLGGAPGIGK